MHMTLFCAAHIASHFTCVYCTAAGTIFGATDAYELSFSYLYISIFMSECLGTFEPSKRQEVCFSQSSNMTRRRENNAKCKRTPKKAFLGPLSTYSVVLNVFSNQQLESNSFNFVFLLYCLDLTHNPYLYLKLSFWEMSFYEQFTSKLMNLLHKAKSLFPHNGKMILNVKFLFLLGKTIIKNVFVIIKIICGQKFNKLKLI